MNSLAERMLSDWQSSSSNGQLPDEHFQALLLRAVSTLLLNPWVDDDQTGRRCAGHVCVQFSNSTSLSAQRTYCELLQYPVAPR